MKTIILVILLTTAFSVPTEYDLRIQPSLTKFANYNMQPEGICAGYSWAKQLAQILSNAVSLGEQVKYQLSAQQLLQCISSTTPLCHHTTRENIASALDYIQKSGITTSSCIQNKPFVVPGSFCKRKCDNGFKADFVFKAKAKKYSTITELLDQFKTNTKISAFAVVKVYDGYNFYSATNPKVDLGGQQFFEYRVAEILGWKNGRKTLVLRMGVGQFWGFNGFAYLDLDKHSSIIDSLYVFDANPVTNIRIQ